MGNRPNFCLRIDMEIRKLVKMANEIAAFFEAGPDPARARQDIASHLKRFWDPRMRRQLLAWIDEHGGEGLKPAVLEAIAAHRALVTPAGAHAPGPSP